MNNMHKIKRDEKGNIIYYTEDDGTEIELIYSYDNKIYKMIKNYDIEIRYYYDNDRIVYVEVYECDELMRKVWVYYRDGYINHIVSDDGIDVWIDKNNNITEPQI